MSPSSRSCGAACGRQRRVRRRENTLALRALGDARCRGSSRSASRAPTNSSVSRQCADEAQPSCCSAPPSGRGARCAGGDCQPFDLLGRDRLPCPRGPPDGRLLELPREVSQALCAAATGSPPPTRVRSGPRDGARAPAPERRRARAAPRVFSRRRTRRLPPQAAPQLRELGEHRAP